MSEPTLIMDDDAKRRARHRSLHGSSPPLRIAGYEQEQFLGRGAYGEVWVAVDSNSGRTVAIKFYNRGAGLDWSLLAREVEKLRHLFSDRYVVQLLSIGWDASPPYFVMEYMPNGSLEDLLHQGALPVTQALELFQEIVVGLAHAHAKGILHCDIKPANILLGEDGKPLLADFGQARLPHERTASLGTLFYMAPEQADLRALPDARWDVYALGAVLYHMLTGTPPYRNQPGADSLLVSGPLEDRLEKYRRFLEEGQSPTAHRQVPGIDRDLVVLIDHCLAVKPRHRLANVQAILDALEARKARLARRPLLLLGAVAPALVALVLLITTVQLFRGLVARTVADLIERAAESNSFAARSVADEVALAVEKRWRILEKAASEPEVVAKLQHLENAPIGSAQRQPIQTWLHQWLAEHHRLSDDQFTPMTRATSWFIQDGAGIQVARNPPNESSRDVSWAHRDYFHGQGRDFPPEEVRHRPPGPLRQPHRSIVFRSTSTGGLMVAFSVPIWKREGDRKEPLGVLAMTATLGYLGDLEGSRNQFAVLVDTRTTTIEEEGRTRAIEGLIIEHPILHQDRDAGEQLWRVNREFLQRAARLKESKRKALLALGSEQTQTPRAALPKRLSHYPGTYTDPVGGRYSGAWLASLEPVQIVRGQGEVLDTDWIVVVQERASDTVRPVQDMTSQLVRSGVVALVLVLGIVLGLWGLVLFLLNAQGRSLSATFWTRLGWPSTSSTSESKSARTRAKSAESGHDRPHRTGQ